jgi:hypothetical protein
MQEMTSWLGAAIGALLPLVLRLLGAAAQPAVHADAAELLLSLSRALRPVGGLMRWPVSAELVRAPHERLHASCASVPVRSCAVPARGSRLHPTPTLTRSAAAFPDLSPSAVLCAAMRWGQTAPAARPLAEAHVMLRAASK